MKTNQKYENNHKTSKNEEILKNTKNIKMMKKNKKQKILKIWVEEGRLRKTPRITNPNTTKTRTMLTLTDFCYLWACPTNPPHEHLTEYPLFFSAFVVLRSKSAAMNSILPNKYASIPKTRPSQSAPGPN